MMSMDETLAGSVGFSIDGKGYIAGGITSGFSGCLTNLRMFDPALNIWTEKAPLPVGQCGGTGKVINGKAYVGLGYGENSFFEYDPSLDSWKNLTEYGGQKAGDLINFQSNGELYFGFGFRELNAGTAVEPTTDLFKYNLAQDKWYKICLLYTSPSPRDATLSRMPSSA